jgi:hypothetical protein
MFIFFKLEITYRISGTSPRIDPGAEISDMSLRRENGAAFCHVTTTLASDRDFLRRSREEALSGKVRITALLNWMEVMVIGNKWGIEISS